MRLQFSDDLIWIRFVCLRIIFRKSEIIIVIIIAIIIIIIIIIMDYISPAHVFEFELLLFIVKLFFSRLFTPAYLPLDSVLL